MSEIRNHWLHDFNTAFGVPDARRKTVARALVAWWQAEGGATRNLPRPGEETDFNPFNTTLPLNGSHNQPGNSVPVQVYRTRSDGMAATLATLRESRYAAIRSACLTRGVHSRTICNAIVASPWGTPAQPMLAVLDDILLRGLYDSYAQIVVYPT
jgi:hypothetical protein